MTTVKTNSPAVAPTRPAAGDAFVSAPSGLKARVTEAAKQFVGPAGPLSLGAADAAMATFEVLLKHRMAQYDTGHAWPPEQLRGAVSAMFREMDNDGLGVFKTDLREVGAKPEVRAYLKDVCEQLQRADGQSSGQVDLWKTTLAHTGGNAEEATRWMATLFQDLSPSTSPHLRLIENPETRKLLQTTLEARSALASKGQAAGTAPVTAFPEGLQVSDPTMYHYYVPAALAAKMTRAGVDPDLAFLTTLLMTTEYEFQNTSQASSLKERVTRLVGGLQQPFSQLRSDGSAPANLEDIYLGSLQGSGNSLPPQTLEQFSKALDADPAGTLKGLFKAAASTR